jgi:hypothetical protein
VEANWRSARSFRAMMDVARGDMKHSYATQNHCL